jgi:predicted DNA-binding transcriptional regulator AlpA
MESNSEIRLLDERQVATRLSVSVGTLRRWRGSGRGPRFFKVGGVLVRYSWSDVSQFVEKCATSRGTDIQSEGGGQLGEAR